MLPHTGFEIGKHKIFLAPNRATFNWTVDLGFINNLKTFYISKILKHPLLRMDANYSLNYLEKQLMFSLPYFLEVSLSNMQQQYKCFGMAELTTAYQFDVKGELPLSVISVIAVVYTRIVHYFIAIPYIINFFFSC